MTREPGLRQMAFTVLMLPMILLWYVGSVVWLAGIMLQRAITPQPMLRPIPVRVQQRRRR